MAASVAAGERIVLAAAGDLAIVDLDQGGGRRRGDGDARRRRAPRRRLPVDRGLDTQPVGSPPLLRAKAGVYRFDSWKEEKVAISSSIPSEGVKCRFLQMN